MVVTQIFTRYRSGNITVLPGTGYFYERSDPSKGYFIRTYRGNNIAAILQAEMQAEPNADIVFCKNKVIAQHCVHIIDSSKIGTAEAPLYTCSAWDFGGWEKVLAAARRIQRWVRHTQWSRCIARRAPLVNHHAFGYKMAHALLVASARGQRLPPEIRDLIRQHYERLRPAHQYQHREKVLQIETKSFGEDLSRTACCTRSGRVSRPAAF